MDDSNKRGGPHREWIDNIVDWSGAEETFRKQELSHTAMNRDEWQHIVRRLQT